MIATTLADLLDATERRYKELGSTQAAAFFLYIDQGEELYVRGEEQPAPALLRTSCAGGWSTRASRADEHA